MGTIRDSLWLWGTKVNALAEAYGFPQSTLTIGRGVQALGVDQAMMCGMLPPTEEEYRPVSHCRSILWEMSFDEGFGFQRPLRPIVDLYRAHPNVAGVLLDDFSTTEINKGAQPDLLADMRRAMPEGMQLWLVIYSMSLDIPNLADYLAYADGISFWVWQARELPQLAQSVAKCHELSGRKPMIAGLYFYDFGDNRPLTVDEMEAQVHSGVDLLRSGECEGLCFLSSSVMDIGLDAVDWTREWIGAHGGDEPL